MNNIPKMYKNKIDKRINNTQLVYSTLNKEEINTRTMHKAESKIDQLYTVEQKINNIFKSPNYIYKADVTIITAKETLHKRIVGKTKTDLITFDNEYIPIINIIDIY